MELDGYILYGDSSLVSMLPDLIFKKLTIEGEQEIWVETKYQDVSLSDTDFLIELARYFISYINIKSEEKFDFYLYVRRAVNWNRWRKIFTSISYDDVEALKIYEALLENDKLTDDEKKNY